MIWNSRDLDIADNYSIRQFRIILTQIIYSVSFLFLLLYHIYTNEYHIWADSIPVDHIANLLKNVDICKRWISARSLLLIDYLVNSLDRVMRLWDYESQCFRLYLQTSIKIELISFLRYPSNEYHPSVW